MEALVIIILCTTIFFFIFFLISWINARKVLTIVLGIITVICFAGTGYLAWKYDKIESFRVVNVEEIKKYGETAYEFTLKSNKGDMNKIWIREKDLETYDNNSMFVKAVNEYQEDKE